ncbi:MAG TPA: branched-chain amino acid ABC transporter permease [Candidatus Tumulicola sp.]|nr:branched-chain amino acid ABC transporter permease [Candidatus Tumulicola sp.]
MIARTLRMSGGIGIWLAVVWLALGLALPWLVFPRLAADIVIWALFAVALDLLLGYAGLLSFGHAMFWGASSYLCGILIVRAHWSFVPAVLGGILAAVIIAAIVGAVSIRRQGIYFAMITLAFAQLVFFFANQFKDFTGAENGLQGVPRPWLFGLPVNDDRAFYYIALAFAVLGVAFALRVVHSPFGQVLTAIRENEPRAISLGYASNLYKFGAFVLSAALSGLAGSLYVIAHGFTSLDTVQWQTSGQVVIMTVLGGMGTIFGPMFGAALYLLINDRLSTLTNSPGFVMGALFIVVVSLFRRGIVGELIHLFTRKKPAA